jgi:hypothetical protein
MPWRAVRTVARTQPAHYDADHSMVWSTAGMVPRPALGRNPGMRYHRAVEVADGRRAGFARLLIATGRRTRLIPHAAKRGLAS